MASTANALSPQPLAAAATERVAHAVRGSTRPSADVPSEGFVETRADAAGHVAEMPARAYHVYEPGVVVAQKFQLVRVLGEGGMGSVWVAKNLALDVHVALKLIRSELAGTVAGLEERLLQEARAAASIEHAAVIQIFDFGLTELRDPFIAMELLHGESLGQTLKRRGKVNPVRTVQTLLPIIEALFVAHERGIVHRDLKPDNIFLSRAAGDRLQPKILDFGIAKLDQSVSAQLTSAGTVLGSPAYMSPEQARGEANVDGRTDVWALCVVLYETISGRLPFLGENYHALLYAILEGQPKTFAELGVNEPLLWSIVARGLEKDRERRCPDMFELGRALAMWLLDRGVQEDVGNAVLRSKWLERPRRKLPHEHHEFFASDPPLGEGPPHTLRSGEDQPPVDANGEVSSGVLLRPANAPTANALFDVPLSTNMDVAAVRSTRRFAPSRLMWLGVVSLGAIVSFSAAVGLAAWSRSSASPPSPRDEDEARPFTSEPRRHSQIPLATVATVVQMPRPLPSSNASDDSSPLPRRGALAEARVAGTKNVVKREPKPQKNELKDPFR